ncbi:hypothetical protein AJ79_02990 [Helicocarpus griseus UAMH5409]|uniref:Glucose-methanol-choline oxidoreductase N-terminal domain-containing protein n=1 Tax=Helicocarpus griseus UAMH5409 TaxID=1447875 RepID=A0A2B7Y1B1_9EURO|nr:hypothetical protein AJ79_02990 [Helicocarpus griseus UAMH5409]
MRSTREGFLPICLAIGFLALSLRLATAAPGIAKYATLIERQEVGDTYDYIIVGGGTAGLTVADRLTEDSEYSVLVVNDGILGKLSSVSRGQAQFGSPRMYNFRSVPQTELGGEEVPILAGKIVGGSSAVNGMIFHRGTAEEYNIWGELGGEGSTWNWENLLPYFQKGVYFTPPNAGLAQDFNITYDIEGAWGQDPNTGIYASYPTYETPLIKIMYDALKTMPGVDVPVDGCAGSHGLIWLPTSMDPNDFTRSYARTGHYDGLNRDNYHLLTESKVNKIVLENGTAVGVTFDANGQSTTITATKEVILSAGAIHTPQILQLSGIGPASLLEQAGIEVLVDLPGVGANFQDHGYLPSVAFFWQQQPTPPSIPSNGDPSTMKTPGLGAFLGMPAISPDNFATIASNYEQQTAGEYLAEGLDQTIIDGYEEQKRIFARAIRSANVSFFEQFVGGGAGGLAVNLHPVSRGSVNIDPANPNAEPLVDYRALTNPIDVDIMVEMVRWIRRAMALEALQQYQPMEITPGAGVTSDADLGAWVKSQYNPTLYHPIGTASKMPRELGGVVDESLLVYGVQKLRVVDASIMPTLVGAHTSQTVYALAEKAADIIKGVQ